MNFHMTMWNKYIKEADVLGKHIQSHKTDNGLIAMEREALDGYIAHITCILKELSNYMDKCGLTMPSALWKYSPRDPTTHPSSVVFKYKDRMSAQAIKQYGEEFMTKPDNVSYQK